MNGSYKVRMTVREHGTQKLRMNQYVPTMGNLNHNTANLFMWSGCDMTILNDNNDNNGISSRTIYFFGSVQLHLCVFFLCHHVKVFDFTIENCFVFLHC